LRSSVRLDYALQLDNYDEESEWSQTNHDRTENWEVSEGNFNEGDTEGDSLACENEENVDEYGEQTNFDDKSGEILFRFLFIWH
jgi:hypothetical protein